MTMAFIFGIAFSLLPVTIISYLINERRNSLKHQQLISSMITPAYWISNAIFDFTKVLMLSIITIIFIYIYGVDFDYMWLALLLYPFAITPYTYFFSFIFPSEDSGEKFMMIHNFLLGGLVPVAVLVLRIIESTQSAGKALMWIFKFSPMYCLCEAVINISSKEIFTSMNEDGKTYKELDMVVGGGAMLFLAL